MQTNTTGAERPRFTLHEMSAILADRKRVPFGFFVSQALWDSVSARLKVEQGFGLGTAPVDFHGLQCVVDPTMPDKEFDVAFTEEAFRERLRAIQQLGKKYERDD